MTLWPEQLRWKKILLGVLLETWPPAARPACGVGEKHRRTRRRAFWVERGGKIDAQIVESAQMNLETRARKRFSNLPPLQSSRSRLRHQWL